jgi:hypothetical protein
MTGENQKNTLHMFLQSFLVLFFELLCIRWLPAHVRHLGYFTNYILMAAFLGSAAGILVGRKREGVIALFTPSLLMTLAAVHFFHLQIRMPMDEVIYFQGSKHDLLPVEPFYMIPALFALVSLLFLLLAAPMGRLFDEMAPLSAYRSATLGSIMGVLTFTLLSYLRLPPSLWMIFFYCIFFVTYRDGKGKIIFQAFLSLLVICSFSLMERGSLWSPYYRITPHRQEIADDHSYAYSVSVNAMGHQTLLPASQVALIPMYSEIYRHFPPHRFQRMLILGAGGGDDTAFHLSRNAGAIDAVEIDPVLLEFGKTLHPEKPYCSPRVKCHVQDGRTFLKSSDAKYDCIIFALPDSLMLSSAYSGIRLESYLFTIESFHDAEKHLNSDGILVMYNYFRKKWLIGKIASMLDCAFGYPPAVFIYPVDMACFITGPGSRDLKRGYSYQRVPPATDDWPFLYLRKPSFPSLYVTMILSILIIAAIFYLLTSWNGQQSLNPAFFFLGAAFMLLETKSIVTFSLLFGATWMVNSAVFVAILVLSYLAALLAERLVLRRPLLLSLPLLLVIVLNYCMPARVFVGAEAWIQYIMAPLFYLLPVFIAGLFFALTFRNSGQAAGAFASSTLGGLLGGMCEYASMVTGYNNLLLPVIIFYLMAFLFFRRSGAGETRS